MHEPSTTAGAGTRRLLQAGTAAAPLFCGSVLAQAFAREGFDFVRHPLSLLTLGSAGWVQSATFILAGILTACGAVGLRRAGLRSVAPVLLVLFGAGTIAAGIFAPDPAFGFPPGSPAGSPTAMSTHAALHAGAFNVSFGSMLVASLMLSRRYSKTSQPTWRRISIANVLAVIVAIAVGIGVQSVSGIAFFVAGACAFGWHSAICRHELDGFDGRLAVG
jgi:hypothetical membrane protein